MLSHVGCFIVETTRVCRFKSILRGVLSLYRTTWQVYMVDCHSSAVAAANRKVTRTLQLRNPEVKRSKKRGAYRKYSAEERTTLQETKIVPCFITWQVFYRDADRICRQNADRMQTEYRLSMLARSHWQFSSFLCLGSIFLNKISTDTTGNDCDCFVTHRYWKETSFLCLSLSPSSLPLQKN